MFKAEYEQFDFEFEALFAKFTPREGQQFYMTVQDDDGRAVIGLTVEQVKQVRDHIDAELAKFEAHTEFGADRDESPETEASNG